MGFLENFLNGDYNDTIRSAVNDKAKRIAKTASDAQLRNWWEEHEYDDDVSYEYKEVIREEMRRRHIDY